MIVAFFSERGELERRLPALRQALAPDGGLWIAWPKRASGVATDLTEDDVRELGLAAGLVDNKVCAIDAVWSGLRFVYRLRDRPQARPYVPLAQVYVLDRARFGPGTRYRGTGPALGAEPGGAAPDGV